MIENFFDFLNQCMNDGNNKEENELIRATSLLSRAVSVFYTENLANGFEKDQAMELTL
ncbi:hypothetical protein [Tetragenococcus halophilus]|uniref:hypothetical protein n=1 Tax=Tetragenococcus halophilus TaxID=51669 RepID=UPI000AD87A4E|nr:hypothetical protein [Tetragenococcus halophilus]GBD71111.1 hypothetical protein TEHN7121_1657 [Tetragenococcus halophilus subsp. halophilus]